eukprot:gene9330-biopygen2084
MPRFLESTTPGILESCLDGRDPVIRDATGPVIHDGRDPAKKAAGVGCGSRVTEESRWSRAVHPERPNGKRGWAARLGSAVGQRGRAARFHPDPFHPGRPSARAGHLELDEVRSPIFFAGAPRQTSPSYVQTSPSFQLHHYGAAARSRNSCTTIPFPLPSRPAPFRMRPHRPFLRPFPFSSLASLKAVNEFMKDGRQYLDGVCIPCGKSGSRFRAAMVLRVAISKAGRVSKSSDVCVSGGTAVRQLARPRGALREGGKILHHGLLPHHVAELRVYVEKVRLVDALGAVPNALPRDDAAEPMRHAVKHGGAHTAARRAAYDYASLHFGMPPISWPLPPARTRYPAQGYTHSGSPIRPQRRTRFGILLWGGAKWWIPVEISLGRYNS